MHHLKPKLLDALHVELGIVNSADVARLISNSVATD
jgi:D-arabinose 5-phosphate isomerase GutQ